jgi:hypothetical protein
MTEPTTMASHLNAPSQSILQDNRGAGVSTRVTVSAFIATLRSR